VSFITTRGGGCVTASQAMLFGLAENGGLYVPAMIPSISLNEIRDMAGTSYIKRASKVLEKYLEDYSENEINTALSVAYRPGVFDDNKIAPLVHTDVDTYVLELFHGPTLAFKDMALQLLPSLTRMAAQKNNTDKKIVYLVATSGDTGKAVLEAFKDTPQTECVVFYPGDGVSRIQELQMITTEGSAAHVIRVEGNFDDAQRGVKQALASQAIQDKAREANIMLSTANSVNAGRLLPQIVYYFSAYADLLDRRAIGLGDAINFVVPTGNFGNILAGYYAKEMGLPVKKLICASNTNHVLSDFFTSGIYSTQRDFIKTLSPSMDILVSSNLERLLFELCNRNAELLCNWMNQLNDRGVYNIGEQRLTAALNTFYGGYADDSRTQAAIKRCFQRHAYLMDPHTAVAYDVLEEYRACTGDTTPSVILSTASPYKFSGAVLSALTGHEPQNEFVSANELAKYTGMVVPESVKGLADKPILHTRVCRKDAIINTVQSFIVL